MLFLTREKRDGITITVPPSDKPQKIHVVTMRVTPGRVRLGIEAADEVVIVRDEIMEE